MPLSRKFRRLYPLLSCLVIVAFASAACTVTTGSSADDQITKATVTRIVDGDTIIVTPLAGGRLPADRVRLIGIDTPEVHGRTDPYGVEATQFTKERLEGTTVWLERDVSDTDRYQRALRYIWLNEPPPQPTLDDIRHTMFNAILLREGYAKVSTHPPDVKYAELFLELQREARENQRGLWGLYVPLNIVHLETPVRRGQTATISIATNPGIECSLTVQLKSGPSRAQGITEQQADENGIVTWSWTVSRQTTPGVWPVTVKCGEQTLTTELEITH